MRPEHASQEEFMSSRYDTDRAEVTRYLPASTSYAKVKGRDVWTFNKSTELGIEFVIAIYFDPDEGTPGYCAQLISPEVEATWMSPHLGHLFSDGVICFGYESMRTRRTLREAYAKSCLWAEGMAIMIQSQLNGTPTQFPFSTNNDESEAHG